MRHPEADSQQQVVATLRNYFPNVLFTASTQEYVKSPIQAGRQKRMGYNRGTPDIQIFEPRGIYHGLFVEMKSKTGEVSDQQKDFIFKLKERGYYVAVCYSTQEALDTIKTYLEAK